MPVVPAGNAINLEVGGKSPYLVGAINPKSTAQVKQAVDWFESNAVTAPVENAIIITAAGDKLRGATVTHNHPFGSDNDYSFSEADRNLFGKFKLACLRGVDETFTYEMNRNPGFLDNEDEIPEVMKGYAVHRLNIQRARFFGYGYRRWMR